MATAVVAAVGTKASGGAKSGGLEKVKEVAAAAIVAAGGGSGDCVGERKKKSVGLRG